MGFKLGIYCVAIIGMKLTPVNLYLLCSINYWILQGAQNKNKTLSEKFQTAPDQNFGSKFSFLRWPLTVCLAIDRVIHPSLVLKHPHNHSDFAYDLKLICNGLGLIEIFRLQLLSITQHMQNFFPCMKMMPLIPNSVKQRASTILWGLLNSSWMLLCLCGKV